MALLIAAPGLYGQKPIRVLEDSVQFGNYLYPGFNVTIPEAGYDNVLKNWIKAQETGTKSKVQTENGEMTIFGAIIKEISSTPPPPQSTPIATFRKRDRILRTVWAA